MEYRYHCLLLFPASIFSANCRLLSISDSIIINKNGYETTLNVAFIFTDLMTIDYFERHFLDSVFLETKEQREHFSSSKKFHD